MNISHFEYLSYTKFLQFIYLINSIVCYKNLITYYLAQEEILS